MVGRALLAGYRRNMALIEFIYYQAWSTSKINKNLFIFSYLWFQALATGRSGRDLQFYHCGKSRGKVFIFSTNFIQVLIRRFLHSCLHDVMTWKQSPYYRSFVRGIHTGRFWGPLGPLWRPVDSLKMETISVLPVLCEGNPYRSFVRTAGSFVKTRGFPKNGTISVLPVLCEGNPYRSFVRTAGSFVKTRGSPKNGNNLRITGPLWGESIPVVFEDRWVLCEDPWIP